MYNQFIVHCLIPVEERCDIVCIGIKLRGKIGQKTNTNRIYNQFTHPGVNTIQGLTHRKL